MNAKQAKAVRRELLRGHGINYRDARYAWNVVSSSKGGQLKNTETGEILRDSALQLWLIAGCGKDIYKGVKALAKGKFRETA